MKLCIICFTLSLSNAFQQGRKSWFTPHDCNNLNEDKSDNEGTTAKAVAGVKYGDGIKSQGAGGSDYPEAAAGKDNRTAETRSKAGEDLLSTAQRENKHEAGFPQSSPD